MKILILVICILCPVYLFLLHPRMRRPDAKAFRGCFFAHRGLHDGNVSVPENSLPAFLKAAEKGYGIEMDVQLSADKIPVVFHDATLSRMCAIDRRVDSMTFEELKKLPLAETGEHIPSFEEALRAVAGRVPLLVEIKMDRLSFDIPEKMDALLSSYTGLYCVESFHPAALLWYRKNRPQIFRGQLSTNFNIENHTLSPFQYLFGKMVLNAVSRPDFISYNWRFQKDPSLQLCRRLFGADCAGWVIRSPQELASCQKTFQMYIFEDFLP